MKTILRTAIASMILMMGAVAATAQDFPTTEAEVKEIICKKWTAKYLLTKGQKMETSTMGFEMFIEVKPDMTYSMSFLSETMEGKWSIDMAKKTVTLFDDQNKAETYIKMIKKEEITAEPADEAEEVQDLKMILVPDKK